MNKRLTYTHILLLLVFSFCAVYIPWSSYKRLVHLQQKLWVTLGFLFGLSDIFISHMIFFILTEAESDSCAFIKDETTGQVYQV